MMAAANTMNTGPAVRLDINDGIAVLRMISGHSKWNMVFLDGLSKALDQVESDPTVKFLVIVGNGKFFSYGLDLDWIGQQTNEVNARLVAGIDALIARVATFPMPTIAAMNGHAYGMGAIFSLACDYRVMIKGRGWFCLPETKFHMKFSETTLELIRLKIPKIQTLRDAALFSKRYTGEEAVAAQIADEVVEENNLLAAAFKYGREIAGDGLARNIVQAAKDKLFGAPIRAKRDKELQSLSEEDKLARIQAFTLGAKLLSSKM